MVAHAIDSYSSLCHVGVNLYKSSLMLDNTQLLISVSDLWRFKAAGALLSYVAYTQRGKLPSLYLPSDPNNLDSRMVGADSH